VRRSLTPLSLLTPGEFSADRGLSPHRRSRRHYRRGGPRDDGDDGDDDLPRSRIASRRGGRRFDTADTTSIRPETSSPSSRPPARASELRPTEEHTFPAQSAQSARSRGCPWARWADWAASMCPPARSCGRTRAPHVAQSEAAVTCRHAGLSAGEIGPIYRRASAAPCARGPGGLRGPRISRNRRFRKPPDHGDHGTTARKAARHAAFRAIPWSLKITVVHEFEDHGP